MLTPLTTIQEAEQFLLAYSPEKLTGETYTLGRMKELMARLGNPQNTIPAVHVAGTSGKTSTSYFIRSLLQAHGKKTGLSISPHITSITERVQVDGYPLEDTIFLKYLNEFIQIISSWQDSTPTYFELLTAFSFWVFHKEQVDYMVVEVGLGGLLDATNVITNQDKISVITPIGLDHTQILGDKIEDIAKQKAGVILPNSTVFVAPQVKVAAEAIEAVVHRTSSRSTVVQSGQYQDNIPPFQQDNFEVAKNVIDYLVERDNLTYISDQVAAKCIYNMPPGRFETYTIGNTHVILDGAHNPQKLTAFINALQLQSKSPYVWLVGFIEAPDAKIKDCLEQIYVQGSEYYFANFNVGQDIKHRKSVDAHELAKQTSEWNADINVVAEPGVSLEKIIREQKERTVIVTGSLYLVAKLRGLVIQLAAE